MPSCEKLDLLVKKQTNSLESNFFSRIESHLINSHSKAQWNSFQPGKKFDPISREPTQPCCASYTYYNMYFGPFSISFRKSARKKNKDHEISILIHWHLGELGKWRLNNFKHLFFSYNRTKANEIELISILLAGLFFSIYFFSFFPLLSNFRQWIWKVDDNNKIIIQKTEFACACWVAGCWSLLWFVL